MRTSSTCVRESCESLMSYFIIYSLIAFRTFFVKKKEKKTSIFRQVIQPANFAFRSLTLHREECDRVLLLIDTRKMSLTFTLK